MNKSDLWAYIGFAVIIILLVGGMGVAWKIGDDREAAQEKWDHTEHNCSQCSWIGYPGLMRQITHILDDTEYYCPNCGWRMR